jgi:hypothetical protein
VTGKLDGMNSQQIYAYAMELKLKMQGCPQGKEIPNDLKVAIQQLEPYREGRQRFYDGEQVGYQTRIDRNQSSDDKHIKAREKARSLAQDLIKRMEQRDNTSARGESSSQAVQEVNSLGDNKNEHKQRQRKQSRRRALNMLKNMWKHMFSCLRPAEARRNR